MRTALGGISAGVNVALAALVLAANLFAAAPARAQSSSGGCFAPCDTASLYLSALGYLEGQLSSNPGRCRTQCAAIRQGCVNAVTAAARCFRGSATSVLDFDRQSCNDLSGTSRNECQSGIASDSQSLNSFIGDDVQCGTEVCQSAFQDCVASCNGPE